MAEMMVKGVRLEEVLRFEVPARRPMHLRELAEGEMEAGASVWSESTIRSGWIDNPADPAAQSILDRWQAERAKWHTEHPGALSTVSICQDRFVGYFLGFTDYEVSCRTIKAAEVPVEAGALAAWLQSVAEVKDMQVAIAPEVAGSAKGFSATPVPSSSAGKTRGEDVGVGRPPRRALRGESEE